MVSFKVVLFASNLIVLIALSDAANLQVGTSVNSVLAYSEEVKLAGIPLKTRTKNVFWSDEKGTAVIKGISALDKDVSSASAIVTAGGVGSSFVNVRLRSERGSLLNYQVQVFV